MNNYLILNFKDAKLFRQIGKNGVNYVSKDYIFTNTVKNIKRHLVPYFVEPITVHQISNMLHVLFNERPVPSLRMSLYSRNDYYFQMALNSYLKIATPKDDFDGYYRETMQTTKAMWNSWAKSPEITWELVNNYINDTDKFNAFVGKVSELLGTNAINIPYTVIIKSVRELPADKRVELFDFIEEQGDNSGLYYAFGINRNALVKPDKSKLTSAPNRCARTINKGVDVAVKLSGQIIIPVSEDDIIKLKTKSKGCATLLDGGLVWIDSIKNENNVSTDEFTCVADISDAKSIPLTPKLH